MLGTLYVKVGTVGAMNVDVDVEKSIISYIEEALDGATITLKVTAVKGYTGNNGQVFIKHTYDVLSFEDSLSLDQISILSVNGDQVYKEGLFPVGSILSLIGTYNVGF